MQIKQQNKEGGFCRRGRGGALSKEKKRKDRFLGMFGNILERTIERQKAQEKKKEARERVTNNGGKSKICRRGEKLSCA